MARLGLGPNWTCLLANDIDPKKMKTYWNNFGREGTVCRDVGKLKSKDMPGMPDLAWASFPCQDLSLAGNRLGLQGERSGTFWGFWSAINKLKLDGRSPPILVLENVCGLLTSHSGQDFEELCRAVASLGYDFGAVVVDAIRFLPQSRPRLFLICVRDRRRLPPDTFRSAPNEWHSVALRAAAERLRPDLRARWIWWNLPSPQGRPISFSHLLEDDESVNKWNSQVETARLLKMMSPINIEKLKDAKKTGVRLVGTVYKRTRVEGGKRIQRAEVRFDGVAGCLRTPGGGSSRQSVIVVHGQEVRSRLLSIREAARLMGVHDDYVLPTNYNEGYHVFGDGLAVPAVAHIAAHLLLPIAASMKLPKRTAKRLAA